MLIGHRATASAFAAVLLLALGCISSPASAQSTAIRVNVGGGAYTDSGGNVWSADTGYNTGTVYSTSSTIAGTSDPALYQSGRWDDPSAPTLQYSFPVTPGWYEVALHFAEPDATFSVGSRRFNVELEGAAVLTDFDIFAESGLRTALIKTAIVRVSDGQLDIRFPHGAIQNPFVNAIQVTSTVKPSTPVGLTAVVATSTQVNLTWSPSTDNVAVTGYEIERCQGASCTSFTPIAAPATAGYVDSGLTPSTVYRYRVRALDADGNASSYSRIVTASTSLAVLNPLRINVGGPAYTDTGGNVWSADTGYNTGTVYSTSSTIAGTSDPTLYQSGRWDNTPAPVLQYSFSVPAGWYEVALHFAEPDATFSVGSRRFDVELEGAAVLTDFDVFAEAGLRTALIKTAIVNVSDGQLNIRLLHGAVQVPFVNAIQVTSTVKPSTPVGLTAVVATSTQVNLTWSPSTDNVAVTGYEIERCQGASCTSFTPIAAPATAGYVDSGLTPSTVYRYRVRALDADGNVSSFSRVVTATTNTAVFNPLRMNIGGPAYTDSSGNVWSAGSGGAVGTVFGVPASIAGTSDPSLYQTGIWHSTELQFSFAVPAGSYQVKLHFAETASAAFFVGGRLFNVLLEGVTVFPAFDIFAEAGANTALIKTATTSVSDGQLNVRLTNGGAGTPFLNAVEIVQTSSPDTQAPSTPVGLSTLPMTTSRIDLSWTGSSDNVGVVGYRVERCQGASCSNFTQIASPTGTTFSDTSLALGTTYRYRVRAVDAASNISGYSSVASGTTSDGTDAQPPTTPTGVVATPVTGTQITLSWNASTDNFAVTGYRVERCHGVGCSNFSQVGTSSGPAFNDVSVGPMASYSYRVRAEDGANNTSDYSANATAVTPAGASTSSGVTYQYDSFGRLKQVTVTAE